MPRRPRIEKVGFHHVVNRGVARNNIFMEDEDYEKFLEVLAIAKKRYDFVLHSLCLMGNHYHLLIETRHRNLSLLIRQINAPYAQYFNRKYKRVGPLWQGRFKNWFVHDEQYLSVLFRYIEQNPIAAKISKNIGEYAWASSSLVFNEKYGMLFKESLLLESDSWTILDRQLNEEEHLSIASFQKIVYQKQETEIVRLKQKSLDDFLKNCKIREQRDKQILEAILDGYKQSEIARYLGLSSAAISYIVKNKN